MRGQSVEERFFSKIDKSSKCWNWTSAIGSRGYGIFWVGGKKRSEMAHRFSYRFHKGEIPEGLVVMHSCDNPKCVNPDHLSVGTSKDNKQDCVKKRRHRFGELNNGGAKLTERSVQRIKIVGNALPQKVMAKIYGVCCSTIKEINREKRVWKHVLANRKEALA